MVAAVVNNHTLHILMQAVTVTLMVLSYLWARKHFLESRQRLGMMFNGLVAFVTTLTLFDAVNNLSLMMLSKDLLCRL